MSTKADWNYIKRESLDRMLDSPGATYEPRGLFICEEQIDGVLVYVAVNNLNGDALTDEFLNRRSAVRWLHGYPVTDEQRYMPVKKRNQTARRLEEIVKGK